MLEPTDFIIPVNIDLYFAKITNALARQKHYPPNTLRRKRLTLYIEYNN
jgi:hypothetical protein